MLCLYLTVSLLNKIPHAQLVDGVSVVGAVSVLAIIGGDVPGIAIGIAGWFVTDYRRGLGTFETFRHLCRNVLKCDLEFHIGELMIRGKAMT